MSGSTIAGKIEGVIGDGGFLNEAFMAPMQTRDNLSYYTSIRRCDELVAYDDIE